MKILRRLLIFIFLLSLQPVAAQYNPYLEKKKKNRPSAKMAKENRKDIKRQNKAAKKQMKRSKREINRANKKRLKGKG